MLLPIYIFHNPIPNDTTNDTVLAAQATRPTYSSSTDPNHSCPFLSATSLSVTPLAAVSSSTSTPSQTGCFVGGAVASSRAFSWLSATQ